MITLNYNNGELGFDKWVLSPEDTLDSIKNRFSHNEFELWHKNNQWENYKLNISEEYIIGIFFLNGLVKFIEIYPKRHDVEDDQMLQDLLMNLGGENRYSWGKVELNVDYKAGYTSVIINYSHEWSGIV